MLVIVALPVQEIVSQPGPKYSMIRFVPPFVVRIPASFRITSFGALQPSSEPVNRTPRTEGARTSHGNPTITSTASAPPTPIDSVPRPPPLGVCESVPMIIEPGTA